VLHQIQGGRPHVAGVGASRDVHLLGELVGRERDPALLSYRCVAQRAHDDGLGAVLPRRGLGFVALLAGQIHTLEVFRGAIGREVVVVRLVPREALEPQRAEGPALDHRRLVVIVVAAALLLFVLFFVLFVLLLLLLAVLLLVTHLGGEAGVRADAVARLAVRGEVLGGLGVRYALEVVEDGRHVLAGEHLHFVRVVTNVRGLFIAAVVVHVVRVARRDDVRGGGALEPQGQVLLGARAPDVDHAVGDLRAGVRARRQGRLKR